MGNRNRKRKRNRTNIRNNAHNVANDVSSFGTCAASHVTNHNHFLTEIKASAALSIRRALAFVVDLVLGLSLILLFEIPITGILAYHSEYDLLHPTSPLRVFVSDLHLLIVPVLLGVAVSQLFNGRSPGCRLLAGC